MFEKEAEDFESRKHYRYEDNDYCGDIADGIVQAYKAGAEFGYNKANEWHYVKDGDLPEDKKDMLMSEHLILLTKMKGTDYLNIALGNYNFSTQEFSYQHIVGLTDVIAWKEIVLPKEIEENE